jgi:hypothetical protein
MPLTTTYTDHKGNIFTFEYFDADSFDDLDKSKCTQTYGVCFYDGKIVLGYSGGRKEYGLIGGTIEEGEYVSFMISVGGCEGHEVYYSRFYF